MAVLFLPLWSVSLPAVQVKETIFGRYIYIRVYLLLVQDDWNSIDALCYVVAPLGLLPAARLVR